MNFYKIIPDLLDSLNTVINTVGDNQILQRTECPDAEKIIILVTEFLWIVCFQYHKLL